MESQYSDMHHSHLLRLDLFLNLQMMAQIGNHAFKIVTVDLIIHISIVTSQDGYRDSD